MDLRTASIRTVSTSLTATAAFALFAAPVSAQDYVVKPGDTVSAIASTYGVSIATIVKANDLDTRATIVAGQTLTIPDAAADAAPTPAPVTTHVVVEGDTLWDLAATYGTSVGEIQRANGLTAAGIIRIGATLTIPGAVTALPVPTTAPAAAQSTYIVVSGDTLWSIANRFGTSVAQIAKDNGIADPSLIRLGQRLTVPGGSSAAATATVATSVTSASSTYVVVRGDTLSGIATRFGSSVAAISAANGLTNPSIIRTGQTLTIPGGAPTGLVGDTFLGRTYPKDVVAAANVNKAALNDMDVPSRTQMQQLVIDTANAMGVDPALAQAIAHQESGFNQRAVSPANAIGCMQVIPTSGEWASGLVGRELNLLIAEDNVTAGVAILKQLQRNGTPLETAIAGYYQGERSVRERGLNPDTVDYVASVMALIDRFE